MDISLKDINRPLLAMILVANVVIYLALQSNTDLSTLGSAWKDYEQYGSSVVLALLVGVVNTQIGPTTKARIVFWRWNNPLPGSRAFTKIMYEDDRIDPKALEGFQKPLPTEPAEQNRLWYKWYKELSDQPSIIQVHREYLFTRDWSSLTILLAVGLVPLAVWTSGILHGLLIVGLLALEYLLVTRAAAVHGNRFVSNVLAIKSSKA